MLDLKEFVILKSESVSCNLTMSLAVLQDAQYHLTIQDKKTGTIAMLTKDPVRDLDEAIELMDKYKSYWL